MSLDPDILTRTVHVELVHNDGTARSGTLTFTNSRMGNASQTIAPMPMTVTLNGTGEVTVTLIANINNPGLSSTQTYWRVDENLDEAVTNTRYIRVNASLSSPIEYASIPDAAVFIED